MFELMKAYETANHEKNKFLRFIYKKYIKYNLKSNFFKKFDIRFIDISNELFYEFTQFYLCTHDTTKINYKFPHIKEVIDNNYFIINYYDFEIDIRIFKNNYNVIIKNEKTNQDTTIHPTNEFLNISFIKEIILMTIYNYCVSYIYGEESNLYNSDIVYYKKLCDIW